MNPDVQVDAAGITALLNEAESLAVLDRAAADISAAAAAVTRRGHSGRRFHIADQYGVEKAKPTSEGGQAAVTNSSSFFHLEQFGSIHQPPQRMVDRAIVQAGYTLEAVPK